MKQGEIWLVNLDPTIGAEIRKSRPCLILNNDLVGRLPLKVIAPLTDLKSHYLEVPWMVCLEPDGRNGLAKASAIDLFQIRSVSQKRLVKRMGRVDGETLQACREALETVIS